MTAEPSPGRRDRLAPAAAPDEVRDHRRCCTPSAGAACSATCSPQPARSSRSHLVAVVGHGREQVGPHVLERCPMRLLAVQETRRAPARGPRRARGAPRRSADDRVRHRPGDERRHPAAAGETLRGAGCRPRRQRRARSPSSPPSSPTPPATAASCATTTARCARSSSRRTPPPSSAAIREINAGIYAFDGDFLADALDRVGTDNAQGENYLTDVVGDRPRRRARRSARTVTDDVRQTEGVNDRVQLARARRRAQPRAPSTAGCATA